MAPVLKLYTINVCTVTENYVADTFVNEKSDPVKT